MPHLACDACAAAMMSAGIVVMELVPSWANAQDGVDPLEAIALLKPALAAIPNVLTDPAPDVEILDFNSMGTVLAVRPYCHTNHFWQVWFDTNKLIAATFGKAGYPAPYIVEREEQVQLDRLAKK